MNRVINSVIILANTAITFIILTIMAGGTTHASDCFNINGESIDANTNTRPFVCFQHDAHNEKAALEKCDRCHHVYDEHGNRIEGESSEDKSCSECHAGNAGSTNSDGSSANSNGSNKLSIELAVKYHKLCRDCHLSEKKGPVVCGECHSRQR